MNYTKLPSAVPAPRALPPFASKSFGGLWAVVQAADCANCPQSTGTKSTEVGSRERVTSLAFWIKIRDEITTFWWNCKARQCWSNMDKDSVTALPLFHQKCFQTHFSVLLRDAKNTWKGNAILFLIFSDYFLNYILTFKKSVKTSEVTAHTELPFPFFFLKSRSASSWHWLMGQFDLTSCWVCHAWHITPITHQRVGFVLSLHLWSSISSPKLENLFNHNAQILTIVRFGSHLLHGIHVIDHDASGDVRPARGFTVHYDDVLQPRHVTQYGLECEVECGREAEGRVRGT